MPGVREAEIAARVCADLGVSPDAPTPARIDPGPVWLDAEGRTRPTYRDSIAWLVEIVERNRLQTRSASDGLHAARQGQAAEPAKGRRRPKQPPRRQVDGLLQREEVLAMAKLTTGARKALPADKFALSGRRFPVENAGHAEAAIRDAPRALNAGDITKGQEQKIDRTADRVLGKYK
jgi:hypothetical protein